ncbi:hypothetical protein AYO43_07445 [Nitrospira sp. SCGC AG-212-E16]|nr:hypothetical protein AYO43_07445 [Nitrospira sp. SCGC AG-212-E16]
MSDDNMVRVATFTVAKVFPPDDPLAIDLLRLMAAYNDVRQVAEWMEPPSGTPSGKVGVDIDRMKLGFLYRALFGILHEAFQVFGSMQTPDFKRVAEGMTPDGKAALYRLRCAGDDLRSQLAHSRNKAIFHYEHDEFVRALTRYVTIFSEKAKTESRFIFKGHVAWYLLPESLRDLIVFDFHTSDDLAKTGEKVGGFLRRVIVVHSDMKTFLEEMMVAYLEDRKLSDEFQIATV